MTDTAVAYLNLDVAVAGPRADLSATPELHTVATETFKKIVAPNGGKFNESLYDSWLRDAGGEIGVLGSGSDYTAFVHNGISSVRDKLFSQLMRACELARMHLTFRPSSSIEN